MTTRISIVWLAGAVLISAMAGCAATPNAGMEEASGADRQSAAQAQAVPESAVMFPAINVLDFTASEAFYVEILGLKPTLRIGEEGSEHREVTLNSTGETSSPGASLVLNWVASREEPYVSDALSRIAFRVRDLDAVMARVRSAGHEVLVEPRTSEAAGIVFKIAFVADPGGTRVELIQVLLAGVE